MDTKIFIALDYELKKDFKPRLRIKLNPNEWKLLLLIQHIPNENLSFYTQEIHLEKGSFTYLVDLLLKKDLIGILTNELDRRSKKLNLSHQGFLIAQDIRQQLDHHIKNSLSFLTALEKNELEECLSTSKKILFKLQQRKDS